MGARGGSSHGTSLGLLTLGPSRFPAPRLWPLPRLPHGRSPPVPTSPWPPPARCVGSGPPALSPSLSITTPSGESPCPCLQIQPAAPATVTTHGHLSDQPRNCSWPKPISSSLGLCSSSSDPLPRRPLHTTPWARLAWLGALKVAFPGPKARLCCQLALCPEPRCFPLEAQFPHL